MAVKKITRKWIINSFAIILIIVIAIVVVAYFSVKSYYYSAARQYIYTRSEAVTEKIEKMYSDSPERFMQNMHQLIENYEYRDKLELMALNDKQEIIITSSGFHPTVTTEFTDYNNALKSPTGIGECIEEYSNEQILAITVLSSTPSQILSGMRYVVSLEKINQQILYIMLLVCAIGICIVLFVIFSSSFFVNSLIKPIGQMNLSTKKIAQGDFSVRLETHSNDEISELCLSINEMAENLANNDRLKNDFISSVSHELRTPLTAIKGWGETILLSDKTHMDPELVTKGVNIMMSEADRLSNMVEELLDFSRIQSGRLHLELVKMDVIAELSDAVMMFTQRAKNEQKEIIYEEPDYFAIVQGDKNRLRQVFINILDNALKYSDEGSTVTITPTLSQAYFSVKIQDTGIGISNDDLPNVKNKFYKGKSNRRGSGIGLAIADEIISQHKGTLEIQSTKNVGTTVSIMLPLDIKK